MKEMKDTTDLFDHIDKPLHTAESVFRDYNLKLTNTTPFESWERTKIIDWLLYGQSTKKLTSCILVLVQPKLLEWKKFKTKQRDTYYTSMQK